MIRSTSKAGGLAGLDRGLALAVGEIGRHGDDGPIDLVAQPSLGVFLEPPQHQRRELGGRIGLAVKLELKERVAHVGLEEAGDLGVPQPRPLLRLLADRGRTRCRSRPPTG